MITETHVLINTIKKLYPVQQFFKDRYFPDSRVYYSEKALIETKKQGRAVAPFVIPIVGGIRMEPQGYRTYEVNAPYIAPTMTITPEDLEKKAFGESPESGRSPAQRENAVEAEHMDDLRNAIYRRHELMCVNIITDGRIVMKHYASANDAAMDRNYQEMELRYYEEAFGNRYHFKEDFREMTAQEKILEFYRIASILKKRHVKVSDIVMTSDVSMLLMADPEFLDFYDKLHVKNGEIDQTLTPDGVTRNGSINVNGVVLTLFTYDESYEDVDGSLKEFLPKGTIAFLAPNMGETVYAQVTFVKGNGFKSYAEKIVPRVVADENNNLMEVQMFSRPVPYPHDWDSWLIANIYDAGDAGADDDWDDDADGDAGSELKAAGYDGFDLLTEEAIEALATKADVIAYAESIGLLTLKDSMSRAELNAAVIEYQETL